MYYFDEGTLHVNVHALCAVQFYCQIEYIKLIRSEKLHVLPCIGLEFIRIKVLICISPSLDSIYTTGQHTMQSHVDIKYASTCASS